MLVKILFWLFVAIDVVGIGLMFVLGLAAAGPSKSSPLAVVVTMLIAPGLLLAGAIALHQFGRSQLLRLLAYTLVSAPAVVLAIGRMVAEHHQITNPDGRYGETPLTRALRELPRDPDQIATVRSLLASGADPNEIGEEPPLVLAVRLAAKVGIEPLTLLLERGADANAKDVFGSPVWFAAIGTMIDPAVLRLLLERGADPKAIDRGGRSGVWSAVNTKRWHEALLLVERGASIGGTSPMGWSLLETIDQQVRLHGDGDGLAALRAAVRLRANGK